MSPIRPGEMKHVLRRCSSSSAAGKDSITYVFSFKEASKLFQFSATLYSKILLLSHSAPFFGAKVKPFYCTKRGMQGFLGIFVQLL